MHRRTGQIIFKKATYPENTVGVHKNYYKKLNTEMI